MMMRFGHNCETTARHRGGHLFPVSGPDGAGFRSRIQGRTRNLREERPRVDRLADHCAAIGFVAPFAFRVLTKRMERNMAHDLARRDRVAGYGAEIRARLLERIETARRPF